MVVLLTVWNNEKYDYIILSGDCGLEDIVFITKSIRKIADHLDISFYHTFASVF